MSTPFEPALPPHSEAFLAEINAQLKQQLNDHAPLYRQSVALLRDAGIDISLATMCGWVMTIGEMLMPVVGAMRSQLLAGTYIQAGRVENRRGGFSLPVAA